MSLQQIWGLSQIPRLLTRKTFWRVGAHGQDQRLQVKTSDVFFTSDICTFHKDQILLRAPKGPRKGPEPKQPVADGRAAGGGTTFIYSRGQVCTCEQVHCGSTPAGGGV